MRARSFIVFSVLCICIQLSAPVCAQTVRALSQYRFDHFDTNSGLPSEFVYTMAQDSLGFMWMQYYGGLSRFDGYNFKVYKHDPKDTTNSLPPGILGPVGADPSGNIWLVAHTPNPYTFPLTKYNRKTDSFIKYNPHINGHIVRNVMYDRKGTVVWLATNGKGLFKFDTKTLETNYYWNDRGDSVSQTRNNAMWDIEDRDSTILIGSSQGLWLFDKETKLFSRPPCPPADSSVLYHSPIWDLGEDLKSEFYPLWLKRRLLFVSFRDFSIAKIFDFPPGFNPSGYDRDNDGNLWFLSRDGDGLFRYDPKDNSLVNIRHIPGDENSLKSNELNLVKVDRDQNIWVATHRGVSRLKKKSINFYNFALPGGRIGESTVYRAGDKDYLIISQRNNDEQEFLIAPIDDERLDSLSFRKLIGFNRAPVHGLWKGKRYFWISLYEKGIAGVPIDLNTGILVSGQYRMLSHDPKNTNSITSNLTTFVWEDPDENLWVGSRGGGLSKVNLKIHYGNDGSVVRYRSGEAPNTLSSNIVWNIYPGENGSFWVITENGIDLFRNGGFERIVEKRAASSSIYKSDDGKVFLSTASGLMELSQNGNSHELSDHPVAEVDDIVRVQDDPLGRLWISNTKGIYCFDPKLKTLIPFTERDGFDHSRAINPFYRKHLTAKGTMVITDRDGVSAFDPVSLVVNTKKTAPVLTRLTINNEAPVIGSNASEKEQYAVSRTIEVMNELMLDYKHTDFSIEFSGMELTSPEKNRYRFILEGYDREWIETDSRNRIATYTNLDAGKYTFKVRASNYHGIWSDQERTLKILVLPPPWKTWWAYSLYGLASIGLILSWRRYDIKRVKLKHRAEHLGELDKLKSQFFANISHEFRTPITLILGPLKKLYSRANVKEDKEELGTMMRNSQRLHRLINQLLDLSKIEAGKMRLHASPTELVEFLREIAASYESMATEKKIKYIFYPEVEELFAYIDPEKLEKVVHNLLSNAFKFTTSGEVILNLKADKTHCAITVKDTGIGISSDQMDKVFDRFYQVDNSRTRGYEGSGLGMALAKELVELHRGRISVQSTEGKGTTFTVILPLGKEHLNKDEISDMQYAAEKEMLSDIVVSGGNGEDEKKVISSIDNPTLLIVEDNADMRSYIRKTLSDQYRILEAENGKAGVKVAEETLPDLIISDIMMPEMDGYKLCSIIKSNEITSYVPVILLTAKADRESKLSGLETGADDYLSKPFDADELKLIVRNRIEERRKMRERFRREVTLEPKQISITSLDEKFLERVLGIIEVHMDDEDFSIEELSREVGFSNMHFYRKIKALSGQTPSQFLRTIRLKRAAEMLAKNSDNVTQVAYAVGFSSLSYFNKCFKEQFGVTPGQYAEGTFKPKI